MSSDAARLRPPRVVYRLWARAVGFGLLLVTPCAVWVVAGPFGGGWAEVATACLAALAAGVVWARQGTPRPAVLVPAPPGVVRAGAVRSGATGVVSGVLTAAPAGGGVWVLDGFLPRSVAIAAMVGSLVGIGVASLMEARAAGRVEASEDRQLLIGRRVAKGSFGDRLSAAFRAPVDELYVGPSLGRRRRSEAVLWRPPQGEPRRRRRMPVSMAVALIGSVAIAIGISTGTATSADRDPPSGALRATAAERETVANVRARGLVVLVRSGRREPAVLRLRLGTSSRVLVERRVTLRAERSLAVLIKPRPVQRGVYRVAVAVEGAKRHVSIRVH